MITKALPIVSAQVIIRSKVLSLFSNKFIEAENFAILTLVYWFLCLLSKPKRGYFLLFEVFFLEIGLTAFFTAAFGATLALAAGLASLLNLDLILAALFLCTKPFLTALSKEETAFFTLSAVLDFTASLIASLKVFLRKLFLFCLFLSCFSFFL